MQTDGVHNLLPLLKLTLRALHKLCLGGGGGEKKESTVVETYCICTAVLHSQST